MSKTRELLQDSYQGCASKRVPEVMDALFFDVVNGTVSPKVAGVACNIASLGLKASALGKRMESQPTEASLNDEDSRVLVHDLLSSVEVMRPALIAEELGLPREHISKVVNHIWFERTPQGVRIAQTTESHQ